MRKHPTPTTPQGRLENWASLFWELRRLQAVCAIPACARPSPAYAHAQIVALNKGHDVILTFALHPQPSNDPIGAKSKRHGVYSQLLEIPE
jgi:hypothetical protein